MGLFFCCGALPQHSGGCPEISRAGALSGRIIIHVVLTLALIGGSKAA